jgi:hypothetical protein
MKWLKYFMLLWLLIINSHFVVLADEGMWVPILMGQKQFDRMQELGSRLSFEDIYSINNSSLKDAVVLFNGNCSGVVVSEEGLLLTNHHCGMGNIQYHSTLEHNYLEDGFWAMSHSEELPNPGLKVYFLVRIVDVTSKVLDKITGSMSENDRTAQIRRNMNEILRAEMATEDRGYSIKPIFGGNQYLMFEYEIFSDVRLVGAPAMTIGKFGGDTDNWVWPRHTGDFSIYRIYANKENKPATYSKDNVPYKPKKVASVSLKGVRENDFTMVLGYPGTTDEYLFSGKADNLINKVYPLRVNVRAKRLDIISDAMKVSATVKIQYSSKYAGIANGWKKWDGAVKGLKKADAVSVIKFREEAFKKWANENNYEDYMGLLKDYEWYSNLYTEFYNCKDLIDETINTVELAQPVLRFYGTFVDYSVGDTTPVISKIEKYKAYCRTFYKNYSKEIDSKIFALVTDIYKKESREKYKSDYFKDEINKQMGDCNKWASVFFEKSAFCDTNKLFRMLTLSKWEKLKADPATKLFIGFSKMTSLWVALNLRDAENIIDSIGRKYQEALLVKDTGKKMYPNANLTFRITYGKVEGYRPVDGVVYNYYTTVDGILEKENPDIDDYRVPDKLKDLIKQKNYGKYADSTGEMRVCFIASNHTSGGNSGSPVFNGKGELVGLNFDRCWEGTMSDILYDPNQCRNISLDIRYLLFVVDKVAGAGHLVNEMQLVK